MGTCTSKEPAKAKRRGAYFICETCKEEFYAYPSYIRRLAKKDKHPRFCSMACYDKTGEKNPFYGKHPSKEAIVKMVSHPNRPRFGRGEDNPNFSRYGEEFVGSSLLWWRDKLFDEIGHCERCGFSDERALTVHHRDRNRKHNTRENLELLCWNCHAIDHWEHKDGMYHFMRRWNLDDKGRRKNPALIEGKGRHKT